jgi:hypothetical protein
MRTNNIGQWKGSGSGKKGRGNKTYQVVSVSVAAVCRTLQCLLLAPALPPEDPTVALVVRVYRLDQRVDRGEETGQQRMASGVPKSGNKLLVVPDH